MNRKLIILGLLLLPALIRAQGLEKCSDVVALPKELYDSFQIVKTHLDNADKETIKFRESRNDLLKKYLGCETQPDVAAMLKQAYDLLQTAESNRQMWVDPYARVEAKVRRFIKETHGKTVEYRYYEPYAGGNLGRVVTLTFALDGDKMNVDTSYYQIPDPK
jgi:hypothetical protein